MNSRLTFDLRTWEEAMGDPGFLSRLLLAVPAIVLIDTGAALAQRP